MKIRKKENSYNLVCFYLGRAPQKAISKSTIRIVIALACAGCGHNYIGETGDVLRNRVTVHKQQIRDPHTRMLGVSKHIDECATGFSAPPRS